LELYLFGGSNRLLLKERGGLSIALLLGQRQGRETTLVFEGSIGTMGKQQLHQVIPAEHSGEHQGRAAVSVLQVQIGFVGYQEFGNVKVAFESGSHEGGVSGKVLVVHVGTGFKQGSGGLRLAIVHGKDQGREAFWVSGVYVGFLLDQLLENGYLTGSGGGMQIIGLGKQSGR
jgi:hypothetical protein